MITSLEQEILKKVTHYTFKSDLSFTITSTPEKEEDDNDILSGLVIKFCFEDIKELNSSTLLDFPNILIKQLFKLDLMVVAVKESFLTLFCKVNKMGIKNFEKKMSTLIKEFNKDRKVLVIEKCDVSCFHQANVFENVTLSHFQQVDTKNLNKIQLNEKDSYYLCKEKKMFNVFINEQCNNIEKLKIEKGLYYNQELLFVEDIFFQTYNFDNLIELSLSFVVNLFGVKWTNNFEKLKKLQIINCEFFEDTFFHDMELKSLEILELKHLRRITGRKWKLNIEKLKLSTIKNCSNYQVGKRGRKRRSSEHYRKKKKGLKGILNKLSFRIDNVFGSKLDSSEEAKDWSTMKVQDWTIDDVIKWMETLIFTKEERDVLLDFVCDNSIDGRKLLKLKFRDFRKSFIEYEKSASKKGLKYCRNKIHAYVQHIQEKKRYSDPNWYYVFAKLLKTFPEKKKVNPPPLTNFIEYSDILSDKEAFYSCYFLPFIKTIKIRKMYDEKKKQYRRQIRKEKKKYNEEEFMEIHKAEFDELKQDLDKFIGYYEKKTGEKLNNNYLLVLPPYFLTKEKDEGEDEDIPFIDDDEEEKEKEKEKLEQEAKQKENLNKVWEMGGGMAYFRVKLVVSEIFREYEEEKRKFRELISPVLSKIPIVKQKFGIFHTSLILGPWYLDWNNSELVIPKQFLSSHAFFALDVKNSVMFQSKDFDLEVIARRVVDLVYRWNTENKYGRLRGKGQGNCQHFVDDVCKELEVNIIERNAMMRSFFSSLRKTGKATVEFTPCVKFKTHFGIPWNKKIFENHSELDKFVRNILQKEINTENMFKPEYIFLKAIDRAFWLKYFRYRKNPAQIQTFAPLQIEGSLNPDESACPFKNPETTFSFVKKDRSMLDYIQI